MLILPILVSICLLNQSLDESIHINLLSLIKLRLVPGSIKTIVEVLNSDQDLRVGVWVNERPDTFVINSDLILTLLAKVTLRVMNWPRFGRSEQVGEKDNRGVISKFLILPLEWSFQVIVEELDLEFFLHMN